VAFAAGFEVLFGRLSDSLRGVTSSAANRFEKIAAGSRRGTPAFGEAGKSSRIDRLIEAGAWTEAALALTEFEMPGWKLRRIIYENGEWLCSLSRYSKLPLVLDDSVDASDEILAVAILRAVAEARLNDGVDETASSVPQVRPADEFAICCDNFI
jgi:hypothetical protein